MTGVALTASAPTGLDSRRLLGMRVDATSYPDAARRILAWAQPGVPATPRGHYVCVANVHMVMEAYDSAEFREIVNRASLVTPDGVPLVWALQALKVKAPSRVYGPTLTLHICEAAAKAGVPIGLYGGTPESLETFAQTLSQRFPNLRFVCKIAPPFRPLTLDEDEQYTRQLAASGAQIILVGIGCPKQERWMAAHIERLPVVMLGVGAAFDFHSGRVRQAPTWLQRWGLEWLFRLLMEPRRLWKRYAKHNPRFVALFAAQWWGQRGQ